MNNTDAITNATDIESTASRLRAHVEMETEGSRSPQVDATPTGNIYGEIRVAVDNRLTDALSSALMCKLNPDAHVELSALRLQCLLLRAAVRGGK